MKQFAKQFQLRWDLHTDNMMDNLKKLLETESFTDVTIAVQDGYSIQCHKWVLAGCSSYFDKLFQHNRFDHPIIIMSDFESHSIESILNYMYTGEVNVSHDQYAEVLRIASFLKVKGLCENMEEINRSDTRPAVLSPRNLDTSTGGKHTASNSIYHSREKDTFSFHYETRQQCDLGSSYENIENPLSKKKKMSKLISNLDTPVPVDFFPQNQVTDRDVMGGYRDTYDRNSNPSIGSESPEDTESSKSIEYFDAKGEDEIKHNFHHSCHSSSASKSGMAECYKQYSRADVEAAMKAVSEQDMSAPQAARRFGVPSRTLYDKLKKAGILPTRAARPLQPRRATSATTRCPELTKSSRSSPVDEASPPRSSAYFSTCDGRLPRVNCPTMHGCS